MLPCWATRIQNNTVDNYRQCPIVIYCQITLVNVLETETKGSSKMQPVTIKHNKRIKQQLQQLSYKNILLTLVLYAFPQLQLISVNKNRSQLQNTSMVKKLNSNSTIHRIKVSLPT